MWVLLETHLQRRGSEDNVKKKILSLLDSGKKGIAEEAGLGQQRNWVGRDRTNRIPNFILRSLISECYKDEQMSNWGTPVGYLENKTLREGNQ